MSVWLVLTLAAVVFVLLRWPCAPMPLERDEGAYAYFALRFLEGDLPYRDMFDHKPPGAFLAYLIPVKLFGTSVVAIHVNVYVWTAAAGFFLFLVGKKLAGAFAAACAVLVFSVLTIEPAWLATAANTEQFMLLPLLASVWCALRATQTQSLTWWFAAGALSMAACGFKPVAATNVLFLAGYAFFSWRRREPRPPAGELLRDALAAAAGAAAVATPVMAYFLWRGAGAEFLDAVVWHNFQYTSQTTLPEGLRELIRQLKRQAAALWPVWLMAAIGLFDLRPSQRFLRRFLTGFLAMSVAGVAIGLNFREHYFLQLAPGLALASGVTLDRAVCAFAAAGRLLASLLVPIAAIAPGIVHNAPFFFKQEPEEKSLALYFANPFAVSARIAEHIRARSGPLEKTLIYGSEPQILFLAERASATRYIIFYPLMLRGRESERRQQTAWEEIERSRPRAVLMTELTASLFEDARSPKLIRPRVVGMLERRYELDGVRVFDSDPPRLLFGDSARKAVAGAGRSGARVPMDMYLFLRK